MKPYIYALALGLLPYAFSTHLAVQLVQRFESQIRNAQLHKKEVLNDQDGVNFAASSGNRGSGAASLDNV
ncbi:MAG: hypothetical protein Q7L55_09105 [Actinomycetota bacterium]|nr:hypothetical protein [Actinomycetota bacterium]